MKSATMALAIAGCATTSSIGVQGVRSSRGASSLEAVGGGGIGIGDRGTLFLATAELGLGASNDGELQGRVLAREEMFWIGDRVGWQLSGGGGVSFGDYQSPAALLEVRGGLHWNVARHATSGELRVVSLALDAGVGAALAPDGFLPAADGAVFGLSLRLRRDTLVDIKGVARLDR
jgi:hypothetical protein